MAVVLLPVSSDHPPRAADVLPGLRPDTALLTVTAHPILAGAVVLAVRGEVDLCTSPLLRVGILGHLRPAGPRLVIVDLTGVGFFAAAGLTVLITAREAAVAAGIRLGVVAHSRPVLLPLTITGLDRVFDIYPDLAHALLGLGGGPGG